MLTADIVASYENASATCPHCGHYNTFNRVSDLKRLDPICNATVRCESDTCGEPFDIGGDLINTGHEMLLIESQELLRAKKFMSAVLLATTACEMFFSHYLSVELVYRPSRREGHRRDELKMLKANADLLTSRIKYFAYEKMRSVYLHLAKDGTEVTTMAAGAAAIASIPDSPLKVSDEQLLGVPNDELRALLRRLRHLQIHELRNRIVHKAAYRPTASEARGMATEAYEVVFALHGIHGLGSVNYHLNEVVRTPLLDGHMDG